MYAAAFHPDGKSFVTECGLWLDATEKSEARFWDLDGRPLREPIAHPCMASAVAFSPDGTKLLTGHADFKARLWDLTAPREPVEFQHDGPIVAAAFSPDGQTLVTGAYDGSARVWDSTGRLVVPPLRRFHMVEAAAFSADRHELAGRHPRKHGLGVGPRTRFPHGDVPIREGRASFPWRSAPIVRRC